MGEQEVVRVDWRLSDPALIGLLKVTVKLIEKGQLLAEIETDKATVEVESMFSGVVRKHLVSEGTIVPVNTPIAVVGGADEQIDLAALTGSQPQEAAAPAAEESAEPEPAAEPAQVSDAGADGQLPGGVRATPLARSSAIPGGGS